MNRADVHGRLFELYTTLPSPVKGGIRSSYDTLVSSGLLNAGYRHEFVSTFFTDEQEFESFEREYEQSDIGDVVDAAQREHERRTGHGRFAGLNAYTPARLYALVRKRKPETIVETGVCNGVSTLVILTALERNGHGTLHSVDYPDHDRIPEGEDPGWIIPDDRRDRWSLTTGFSQEELPDVVADLKEIDLFVHDTKAAILDEELEIVWPLLAADAPVVADDVHQSDVFGEVCESYSADSGFVAPNVGYLVKRM